MSNPSYRPEDLERNQVWKFQGRLWRVDQGNGSQVELSELLGGNTMTALSIWLLHPESEWELIYEHDPPEWPE